MADEYIGTISGIGDAANNINVITGDLDAAFINMLFGGTNDNINAGIVANALGNFESTPIPGQYTPTKNVTIKSGIAFAYGYKGKIDQDMTFSIQQPVKENTPEYYYVVMQFDTTKSPNVCKVYLDYQGTNSAFPTYLQNNLLKVHGVYNLVLYRIDVIMLKNVSTYTTTIATRLMASYYDKPYKAHMADYAQTQPEGTSDSTPASTKFVYNTAGAHEEVKLVASATQASWCYANLSKIGRNVLADFNIYFGANPSTPAPTLNAFTANNELGNISNDIFYPATDITFIVNIIDALDKGVNGYIITIKNDGTIVSGGKVFGNASASTKIYAITGAKLYNLDN